MGWMVLSLASINIEAQKTISEGTFIYDIVIQPKNSEAKSAKGLTGATSSVFLKGGLSRTEMSSALGNETTIYNNKAGTAVILKEYSGQKLMITLDNQNWKEQNTRFNGLAFENTADTKTINGYKSKKAIAKLKDGSTITVYYTPDLVPLNKDYNEVFKNLPGFPLEYEFETDKMTFKYSLSKMDFSPVPASKFDFPKSGYRTMTYNENKQNKRE